MIWTFENMVHFELNFFKNFFASMFFFIKNHILSPYKISQTKTTIRNVFT